MTSLTGLSAHCAGGQARDVQADKPVTGTEPRTAGRLLRHSAAHISTWQGASWVQYLGTRVRAVSVRRNSQVDLPGYPGTPAATHGVIFFGIVIAGDPSLVPEIALMA
eukprot:1384042-Rhodomonas_salina.1